MIRFSSFFNSMMVAFLLLSVPVWALCPQLDKGEVEADCPWAEVGRALHEVKASSASLEKELNQRVPAIVAQLKADGAAVAIKNLWGRSVNFDEGAKGQIVDSEVLEALASYFKPTVAATYFQDREVVHAGLEHTYGYLFSLLRTPYGYKRSRWVSGEMEQGMGLQEGILSPNPPQGTLFYNVSYFLSRIAFRNDESQLRVLTESSSPRPPLSLREYPYSKLHPIRLEEVAELSELNQRARTIRIITDFVPFVSPVGGNNTHLLIYSLVENDAASPKLITAFCVNAATVAQSTDSATLGENRPIQLRYNAYSEAIYGEKLKGIRRLK